MIFSNGLGAQMPVILQALPQWMVGMMISTPLLAVVQGATLLYDYRTNHAAAPRPETPSRGVVMLRPADTTARTSMSKHRREQQQQRHASSRPPLRLLVIGDSLAVGVGTSMSSTPGLPQSIAQALSQSCGVPVYWTCVGAPGLSATEVIEEIRQLQNDYLLPTPIIRRLADWQAQRKQDAFERIDSARHRIGLWWGHIGKPVELKQDLDGVTPLWQRMERAKLGFQRDFRNFRRMFEKVDLPKESSSSTSSKEEQSLVDSRIHRMVRRNSLDPLFVKQYDVAIVLTGLNDLKDSFLPFMMSAQRAKMLAEARKENGSEGLQGQLLRITRALTHTLLMSSRGHAHEEGESISKVDDFDGSNRSATLQRSRSFQREGPLIVFPALPLEPIELSHRAPLSWFLVPLVRGMDRMKQTLAEAHPDLVLFVPSPESSVYSDAEAQRGPLWESSQTEHVLFRLTDIGHSSHSRIERLMQNHYKSLVLDSDDADDADANLYQFETDEVVLVKSEYQRYSHPGATLVSADGIHPNDQGYDMWGKFIARAIVAHWKKQHAVPSYS